MREWNFDGIVGPAHNYSGLAYGNVASAIHAGKVSNPKKAALQGIAKMRFLSSLGLAQGFFPPQPRPNLGLLRQLGFIGEDTEVLSHVAKYNPVLLAQVYSSSFMWAANAATVTPSSDSADGKLHFTPANLISTFHRSTEPAYTTQTLHAVFPDSDRFTHHASLPPHTQFGDEGAANHTRLKANGAENGFGFFVYGKGEGEPEPTRFPARQTRWASIAVARQHGVQKAVFARQNPAVIDAGVFHNDVIAVGHEHVLLCHELAFAEQEKTLTEVKDALGGTGVIIQVSNHDLPVEDAIKSYFFNSQIVTLPDGSMAIIAPQECEENNYARQMFARISQAEDNPIAAVHYVDVRESMQNGGGPACLRLRVAMTSEEEAAVPEGFKASEKNLTRLETWVNANYRDRLEPKDLTDPELMRECRRIGEATQLWLRSGEIPA